MEKQNSASTEGDKTGAADERLDRKPRREQSEWRGQRHGAADEQREKEREEQKKRKRMGNRDGGTNEDYNKVLEQWRIRKIELEEFRKSDRATFPELKNPLFKWT